MKRFLLIYITVIICSKLQAQKVLNTVISIDDKVMASYNIAKVQLISFKDTLTAEYESGRIILTDKDYETFSKYRREDIIVMKINYQQHCPLPKEYIYEISIKIDLLNQRYFNIAIYNFENYPNLFAKNEGYGFEFNSPLISQSLPRNKKKHIIPFCKY